MATVVEFYKVVVIADCEGRMTKTITRLASRKEASKFAHSDAGRDMYGRPGDVREEKFTVHATAEEAGAEANEKLLEEAMNKLSVAERSAVEAHYAQFINE